MGFGAINLSAVGSVDRYHERKQNKNRHARERKGEKGNTRTHQERLNDIDAGRVEKKPREKERRAVEGGWGRSWAGRRCCLSLFRLFVSVSRRNLKRRYDTDDVEGVRVLN